MKETGLAMRSTTTVCKSKQDDRREGWMGSYRPFGPGGGGGGNLSFHSIIVSSVSSAFFNLLS
jgi:hypothetical protein